MKILLCTVPASKEPEIRGAFPITPKMAIVTILNWMQKCGYNMEDCDFLDIDMIRLSTQDLKEYFKKTQPVVIGLSAVVSTSYLYVKEIAAIAREICPNVWIVMGGYLSASAAVVLRKTEVDVCVRGDGEIAFVEFVNYVEKYQRDWNFDALNKIKGLVYLDDKNQLCENGYGDSISDSEIPFPDYDVLQFGLKDRGSMFDHYFRNGPDPYWFAHDLRSYEKTRKPKIAVLWVTKGCVACCTFCQRESRKLHRFDIDKLEMHLKMLVERFNVGFIHIGDENFGADKAHTRKVASLMSKYNLLWIASGVRCTDVTLEDISFYKRAGCCGLKFGVESGSQKILNIMEKRFSKEQVKKAIGYCAQCGVYSPMAVMVGMPGETDDTAKETGIFLGELTALQGLPLTEVYDSTVFYAVALPGTPLYEYGQKIGVIGTSIDGQEKYLIDVSNKQPEKMDYLNVSGQPIRSVLFWDIMVKLEGYRAWHRCRRKFKEKCQIKVTNHFGFHYLFDHFKQGIKQFKGRSIGAIIRHPNLGVWAIPNALWNMLVMSWFVAILPRKPLYFVLKNIVYLRFLVKKHLMQRYWKRQLAQGHSCFMKNLYKKQLTASSKLSEEDWVLIDQQKGSLRTIISQMGQASVNELAIISNRDS